MGAKPQGKQQVQARPPSERHENRDARAGWIFGVIIFLLLCIAIAHFMLWGGLNLLKRWAPPSDAWEPSAKLPASTPAGPRLQVSPQLDLTTFRAREEEELNTYGWINKTAGVVRIPISNAMDLVLKKGLPVRPDTNHNQTGMSSYQLLQQRPLKRAQDLKTE